MTISPVGDRIVTTVNPPITEQDGRQASSSGTVVAVGPDQQNIKAGDELIFPTYAGTSAKSGDDSFVILSAGEVLAVITQDTPAAS